MTCPEVSDLVVLQEGPQPEEPHQALHLLLLLAVAASLGRGPPDQAVYGGSEPHYNISHCDTHTGAGTYLVSLWVSSRTRLVCTFVLQRNNCDRED